MSDFSSQRMFSCPACGAQAQWNAGKRALVCPACGTVSPMDVSPDGAVIAEHDLVTALRDLPSEARGWQSERRTVKCQSCQAISVFAPSRVAQQCEFCGSPSLVPYDDIKPPIRPESVLPFTVSTTQVRDALRKWYGTRWFAPNLLKKSAMTDTLKGIYLPYWTFDAQTQADWTAESGTHYYETETYRDNNGGTQTRQVQRTRWQPASGALEQFFDDELEPATRGVHAELLRKVEPFATKDLVPYDAGYLSGWTVEQYQIDLITAAKQARVSMDNKLRQLCGAAVPGDTYRNLAVQARFSGQTFKHILVPVWLITYAYHGKSYQVLANGASGQLAGEHPLSWLKIGLAVIAVLMFLGLLLLMSNK